MSSSFADFLSGQLYPDLKNWIPSLFKQASTPIKKATAKCFKNPTELLNALKKKEVEEGHWISLECKPSTFGPFLRNHFISPFIGSSSDMRLGPQIESNNFILAMMGQVTSHLKPVGLYPPIGDDLYQICLYPSDSATYGMIGLLPEINELVQYIPAVCKSRHLTFSNMSCNVNGIVRQISPELLAGYGAPIEKWEELRQAGAIWFIDLSDNHSEINPHGQAVTTEVWGGLYASGHIEVLDGEVPVQPLIDGMAEAFKAAGVEPHVTQNQAARKEIIIFGRGMRAIIDIQAPIYSLHMDAELGINYGDYRKRFDASITKFLNAISDTASGASASLGNPNDLDFSYSNSAKAYSVLESLGSEHIADPLALAMRNWHRKKNGGPQAI